MSKGVGFISIQRKIEECEIWDTDEPFDRRSAWIDLLLLMNHKDNETIFDNKPITVKRGQRITSVRKLSARWHWGKDKTLAYLRLLERLGMIEREADSRRTLITVVNYDFYQSDDGRKQTVSRQSTDSKQTVNRHSSATNNNDNNENNENNKEKYYPDNADLDKSFNDYIKMRKTIKAPMSDRAIELAMSKLEKLSGGDNYLAIEIVNQSILNSWKGLFPLKTNQNKHRMQNTNNYDFDDLEKRLLGG